MVVKKRWRTHPSRVAVSTARYQAQLTDWTNSRSHVVRAMFDFANIALRGVVLANGAAAIAILAFIGHILSVHDPSVRATGLELSKPLMLFAIGVGLGVVAAAFSYLTQVLYVEIETERRRFIWGNVARGLAVLTAVSGISIFFVGIDDSIEAFGRATPAITKSISVIEIGERVDAIRLVRKGGP